MNRTTRLLSAVAALLMACIAADAATLRVSPVTLSFTEPVSAGTLRVWNDASRPINVQLRIFRWTQKNGEDFYEATRDVSVSPPMTTLAPNREATVRIVRTAKSPIAGEESYRLVVDELPDRSRAQASTVKIVVRHAIPVFFTADDVGPPSLSWRVKQAEGGYSVTVRNSGESRVRLSGLSLSSNGQPLEARQGPAGYALGRSTVTLLIPSAVQAAIGSTVTVSANSDTGPLNATVELERP